MDNACFSHQEEFDSFLDAQRRGGMPVVYENVPEYAGMVRAILILFDLNVPFYRLNLQWISFGLDPYAENLLEEYVYAFESREKLLEYLRERCNIPVTRIPKRFSIDTGSFPSPFREEDRRREPEYREAWERFKRDFAGGRLLDPDPELVFTSLERGEWLRD